MRTGVRAERVVGMERDVLLVIGQGNSWAASLENSGCVRFLRSMATCSALALHYAHEFYEDTPDTKQGCLTFPGNPEPNYLDFLYFAFVLGTTSQTSDVTISSSAMRRLALIHGVIAFFFNTTLLALVVNIAAGLIRCRRDPTPRRGLV